MTSQDIAGLVDALNEAAFSSGYEEGREDQSAREIRDCARKTREAHTALMTAVRTLAAENERLKGDLAIETDLRRAAQETGQRICDERDSLRACIASLEARVEAGRKWQPIETAPKDHAILIAGGAFDSDPFYGPLRFDGVTIAYWYHDHWRGEQTEGHDNWKIHEPTHWMALPPAIDTALKQTGEG